MAREARRRSSSGIYHVILRGANRQEIFHDVDDHHMFLAIVEKYKNQAGMSIFGWCLMDNHVHLLLKEGSEEISQTMKRIGVSFVSYYHWKYQTTGHLFQDRFKSENIESARSFLNVLRYIHQNPVKAGMVKEVDEWCWSSCLEYYGISIDRRKLVDQEFLFSLYPDGKKEALEEFKKFNELPNSDSFLDIGSQRKRLLDEEAREAIKQCLGESKLAHVKSLPREERTEVLRRIKKINGISQRQAARILGVSPNLIFKA